MLVVPSPDTTRRNSELQVARSLNVGMASGPDRDRRRTQLLKDSIQLPDLESGRRRDLDPDGATVRREVDDQPVARLYRPLRAITVA